MTLRPSTLLALLVALVPGVGQAQPAARPPAAGAPAAPAEGARPAGADAPADAGPPPPVEGPREVDEPVLGATFLVPEGWKAGWEEREDGTRIYVLRRAAPERRRGGGATAGEVSLELESVPADGQGGLRPSVPEEAQAQLDALRDRHQTAAHRASRAFELLGGDLPQDVRVRGGHPGARVQLTARVHALEGASQEVELLAAVVRTPHALYVLRGRWPPAQAVAVRAVVDALLARMALRPPGSDPELLRRLTGCWERDVPSGTLGAPPLHVVLQFAADGTYRYRPPGVGADEPGEEQGRFRTAGPNAVVLAPAGGITPPHQSPVAFPEKGVLRVDRDRYSRCP